MRVGERALQGVIGRYQTRPELIAICGKNVNASRIKLSKFRFSGYYVQRCTLLRASLGESKCSGIEMESCRHASSVRHDAAVLPMQPSRDHQVEHQPKFIVELDGYPLSDPADCLHRVALRRVDRRHRCSQ